MHFMSQPRYNPRTQRDDWYYRIKESFRDLTGRVRSRVMLNVGFIEEPHRPEDIRDIGKCLTYLHEHQGQEELFGNPLSRYNGFVQRKTWEFWHAMVNNDSTDAVKASMEESREKAERLVDVNTIQHTDAREIGAEWVCLQAICEFISGNQEWRPGFHSIYKVAPSLFELKDRLENHLCKKTDNLFNITNRIAIFDLTNFYFEGRKEGSRKAQFGRSKEKRSDCKLLVLALCINREGFIRYSSILAGNTADPNSLPDMVDTLNSKTRVPDDPKDKVLVCLDAGIATEENLLKIKEKGYNYLCVSRRRLTDYEIAPNAQAVTVLDSKRQPIRLTQVKHEEDGDYYLEINSHAKQLKETSMNRKFKERFEEELQKAKDSLTKKNRRSSEIRAKLVWAMLSRE